MENSDFKCLLCLLKTGSFINIFEDEGKQLNIASILTQFFWFEVKESDLEVKRICTTCWEHIADFHSFYTKVFELHHTTFVWGENAETNSLLLTSFKVETAENSEALNSAEQTSIKNENLDIKVDSTQNENGLNDSNNSCCSESELELDFTARDDDEISASEEYEEPKVSTKIRIQRRKTTPTDIDQKPKTERKKTVRKISAEQIAEEDKQINDFFKMICELCTVEFKSFQNLQSHYRDEHNLRGYLSCCSKKFFLRYRAVEHVQFHINPDAFRCQICKKSYTNKNGLMNHMDTHCPTQEKPYKCLKCPKEFAKKYQLQQHQVRHVPDEEKSFTCNECGKAFARNSILKSHIRGVHENAYVQICEICGKYLKTKMFYEQHCRIAHSEVALPKVQCPQCGLWLKHESSYRKHMLLHEDEKRTHICDLCGKQSPNGRALQIHKKRVHFSERTHKCTLCEKAFKRATSLKEHMATHTGEVLYTCPHCPKTFNSGANMHSHRKKMHRKEWDENRMSRLTNIP